MNEPAMELPTGEARQTCVHASSVALKIVSPMLYIGSALADMSYTHLRVLPVLLSGQRSAPCLPHMVTAAAESA